MRFIRPAAPLRPSRAMPQSHPNWSKTSPDSSPTRSSPTSASTRTSQRFSRISSLRSNPPRDTTVPIPQSRGDRPFDTRAQARRSVDPLPSNLENGTPKKSAAPARRPKPVRYPQRNSRVRQGDLMAKAVPAALQHFRALAGPRHLRITTDAEGFPVIPGRYGRIEWFDRRQLAVYSDRPRLFLKLWAIPGVRRNQTGDQEMRATFPLRRSSRWPPWSGPSAGAGVAGDAPGIWSQTPDKRVLQRPRIASRWPGRLSTWACMEDDPKVPTCPCYPDRAPTREDP
jgi:hypothetical protein